MHATFRIMHDVCMCTRTPQAYTDNIHVHDAIGPNVTTPEAMSQAVKILKQRLLKRILDSHNMDQCLIFCRWAVARKYSSTVCRDWFSWIAW